MLCPKGEKVLGIKGQKNVHEVHLGSDKESLTVLNNINAAGSIAPTMIVKLSITLDWSIGRSDKGWMTRENFYEYIVNIFYPWVVDQMIPLPVVIFLDSNKSHLTYYLSKFCPENKIIVISLPPNATHFMQPLDVSLCLNRSNEPGLNSFRTGGSASMLKG